MTGSPDDRAGLEPLLAYIVKLVIAGERFKMTFAADHIGRTHQQVRVLLQALHDANRITLQTGGNRAAVRHRIALPDGRATAWAGTTLEQPQRLQNCEIDQRRREAVEEREQHRRYWLSRERSIMDRPQPSDAAFMDKATLRALQGFA